MRVPVVDRSLKGAVARIHLAADRTAPSKRSGGSTGPLLDHVNRNAAAEREWPRAIAILLEVVGRESSELARFHSLLVQYSADHHRLHRQQGSKPWRARAREGGSR